MVMVGLRSILMMGLMRLFHRQFVSSPPHQVGVVLSHQLIAFGLLGASLDLRQRVCLEAAMLGSRALLHLLVESLV